MTKEGTKNAAGRPLLVRVRQSRIRIFNLLVVKHVQCITLRYSGPSSDESIDGVIVRDFHEFTRSVRNITFVIVQIMHILLTSKALKNVQLVQYVASGFTLVLLLLRLLLCLEHLLNTFFLWNLKHLVLVKLLALINPLKQVLCFPKVLLQLDDVIRLNVAHLMKCLNQIFLLFHHGSCLLDLLLGHFKLVFLIAKLFDVFHVFGTVCKLSGALIFLCLHLLPSVVDVFFNPFAGLLS